MFRIIVVAEACPINSAAVLARLNAVFMEPIGSPRTHGKDVFITLRLRVQTLKRALAAQPLE